MLPQRRHCAALRLRVFIIVLSCAAFLFCAASAGAQVLPESGWWWDPNQSGLGFFIDRQGSSIFMVNMLYDSRGQATWNLASGFLSGSTFSSPLNVYCCGETLTGAYQPNRSNGSVGNVSITWSDPRHGTMTWPGGTFAIQRLSFTASATPAPPQPGAPQTGLWWDPNESGVGYASEFQGNRAFVVAFVYNSDSTPIWYLFDGDMQSPTLMQAQWTQYCCGETVNGPFQPNQVAGTAGNFTMQFSSPTNATYTKPGGQQVPIEHMQVSGDTPIFPVSVLTQHNDNQRTGQNLHESILSPSNVNASSFGKKAAYPVDGQVYAQPLVATGVNIGGTARNVVYVTTQHDSVYAFDADGKAAGAFWQRSFINPAAGIIPAQSNDVEGVAPELGVLGTPAIDQASNTMYLVSMTNENGNNIFRLHALDLSTGAEKFGGPVVLQPKVQGTGAQSVNGMLTIDPGCYQRPALLLQSGNVYVTWGHCLHGWVEARNATTLAQVAVFNSSPNGKGASIWMGGGGPAADQNGNVYLMTGVDADSTTTSGYSDAFLKLSPSLQLLDFFMPSNNASLTADDMDLGSGSPIILPDNASPFPQEVVGAGKDGRVFVLNRNDLGGFTTSADRVVQEFQSGTQPADNFFDVPTYWNGLLYIHGENDVLRAYPYSNGHLSTTPQASASTVYGIHGATASLSAYGNRNGIVWELQVDQSPTGPAVLHAYSAANVGTELYNSAQAGTRDTAGPAVKFTVPTVANAKVYVGTANQLDIYGLLQ
jgi:hypothetical protein